MKEQGMEPLTLERVGELAEMLYKAQDALPVFSTGLDDAIDETLTALDAAATTIAAMRAENERLAYQLKSCEAWSALHEHYTYCEQCAESGKPCSKGKALHRACDALTDTEGSGHD